MKKYYVYILIDPRSNVPFYVGKGCGNRAHQHFRYDYVRDENKHKANVIKAIKAAGLCPKIDIIERNLSDEDAYEKEKSLIEFYGRYFYDDGGILTNVHLDSKSPNIKGKSHPLFGKKLSFEHRKKISESRKKGFLKGTIHVNKNKSKYIKKNFRNRSGENNPMYGRQHSETTLKKFSDKRKGFIQSREHIDKRLAAIQSRTLEEKNNTKKIRSTSIRNSIYRRNAKIYKKIFDMIDLGIKKKDIIVSCKISYGTLLRSIENRKLIEDTINAITE